jgi:hypothetical protein
MNYVWKFYRVGPDLYAAYRDGQFYHIMTSRQIWQDARFHYDHAHLMCELNERGEATREICRGRLSQMSFTA